MKSMKEVVDKVGYGAFYTLQGLSVILRKDLKSLYLAYKDPNYTDEELDLEFVMQILNSMDLDTLRYVIGTELTKAWEKEKKVVCVEKYAIDSIHEISKKNGLNASEIAKRISVDPSEISRALSKKLTEKRYNFLSRKLASLKRRLYNLTIATSHGLVLGYSSLDSITKKKVDAFEENAEQKSFEVDADTNDDNYEELKYDLLLLEPRLSAWLYCCSAFLKFVISTGLQLQSEKIEECHLVELAEIALGKIENSEIDDNDKKTLYIVYHSRIAHILHQGNKANCYLPTNIEEKQRINRIVYHAERATDHYSAILHKNLVEYADMLRSEKMAKRAIGKFRNHFDNEREFVEVISPELMDPLLWRFVKRKGLLDTYMESLYQYCLEKNTN